MSGVTICTPYPVSTNRMHKEIQLPVKGKPGRFRAMRVLSDEAKEFIKTVHQIIERRAAKPFNRAVALKIELFPTLPMYLAKKIDPRASNRAELPSNWHHDVRCVDVDNALKCTLDALKGKLFTDDRQVFSTLIKRMPPDAFGPRMVIHIDDAPDNFLPELLPDPLGELGYSPSVKPLEVDIWAEATGPVSRETLPPLVPQGETDLDDPWRARVDAQAQCYHSWKLTPGSQSKTAFTCVRCGKQTV